MSIDSLLDNWEEWRSKIITFSKVESATRPFIKKKVAELESNDQYACLEGIFNVY